MKSNMPKQILTANLLYELKAKHIREYVGLFQFPMPESFSEFETVLAEAADKALVQYRARYRRAPNTVTITVQSQLANIAKVIMDVSGSSPRIVRWGMPSAGNPLSPLYREYMYLTKKFNLARFHGLKSRSEELVSIDAVIYRENAIPCVQAKNLEFEDPREKLAAKDVWEHARIAVNIRRP